MKKFLTIMRSNVSPSDYHNANRMTENQLFDHETVIRQLREDLRT
jgi:hypothetical protein